MAGQNVYFSISNGWRPLVYLQPFLTSPARYIYMMHHRMSRYWVFQFLGWGLFAVINIFFAVAFNRFDESVMLRIIFYTEMGILISHLMREVIHRMDILLKSLRAQILNFVVLTFIFSFLIACVVSPFETIYGLRLDSTGRQLPYFSLLFTNFLSLFPLFLFWNAFYFMYHFISKMRKQELDTIKLEALVRQLELQTIKAHINPHFIFNSLNSIRALVDEHPARARECITRLSNILRSSLSADKAETVSFEKELAIVRDYLELERMRFEERLQVQIDVDEKSLRQMVPPMMLQTLVENAIKHGISKQVEGGSVRIVSSMRGQSHELLVQNTGHLNGFRSSGGFGLSSTRDRLNLLYGDRADFEIKQVEKNLVEAKVRLPLGNK